MEMVEHVTPVPNAPAFVEGVVFSRGQVVPVDQPARAVRVRTRGPGSADAAARGADEDRRVGLLADDAREFVSIPDASIRPPDEAIGGLSGNYLDGVATLGERIVLILDLREVVETIPPAAA